MGIVIIEGIDGSGKTTLAREVFKQLKEEGINSLLVDRKQPEVQASYKRYLKTLGALIFPSNIQYNEIPWGFLSGTQWMMQMGLWYSFLYEQVIKELDPSTIVIVDGWFYKLYARALAGGQYDQQLLDTLFEYLDIADKCYLLNVSAETCWTRRMVFKPLEISPFGSVFSSPKDAFISFQSSVANNLKAIGEEKGWEMVDCSGKSVLELATEISSNIIKEKNVTTKHHIDCIIAVPGFFDKNIKHLFSNTEMLGPKYIEASLLYHGYSVDLFNSYSDGISAEDIIDAVIKKNPYLVGVTCASQRAYPFVKEFIYDLIEKGFDGKIVIGGFYATIEAKKIMLDLPMVDAINLGEGEFSFAEILHSVITSNSIPNIPGVAFRREGQMIVNPPVKLTDLDFPFFPKRTPIKRYAVSNMIDGKYIKGKYYNVVAGRGCYGRCSFCSIYKLGKTQYRVYRSPQNILDEIQHIIDEQKVDHIWFTDEIFFDHSIKGRKWLKDFCNEIKSRNMHFTFNIELRPNDFNYEELTQLKEVGLTAIFVGIESGVQRILDEMRKDTTVEDNNKALDIANKLGIKVEMGWISIIPTMTFEELKKNYEYLFATSCYTEENIYNRLNLYGECYYEQILKENNLLKEDTEFYDRFGYQFLDERVGSFALIINNMRTLFTQIKIKTIPIQEKISLSGDYAKYLAIRCLQKQLWKDLVVDLLQLIDKDDTVTWDLFQTSSLYQRYLDKIHLIEQVVQMLTDN